MEEGEMVRFMKPTREEVEGDRVAGEASGNRSIFQQMLDALNTGDVGYNEFARLASGLVMASEKVLRMTDMMRRDLLEAVHEAGGAIADSSVEAQLSEFIPKHIRNGNKRKEQELPDPEV
jgi:hypothetical protein